MPYAVCAQIDMLLVLFMNGQQTVYSVCIKQGVY